MRFLLDENVDFQVAAALKARGHDVASIAVEYPGALDDRDVLAIAVQEQCMLITNDLDFGEIIFRQHLPHAGVILFRLGEESLQTKVAWLDHVLANHAHQLHDFLVITGRGVRVRQAPNP